jgi:hypothetical protein
MNIYKLSQTQNDGWDTYSDCVVISESENAARMINPNIRGWDDDWSGKWCSSPDYVTVEYLGVAKEGSVEGIVCASYHAG